MSKKVTILVGIILLMISLLMVYIGVKDESGKGYEGSDEYKLIGVPFCPTKSHKEKPNRFREKHIMFTRTDKSFTRSPLDGAISSASPTRTLIDDEAILVLVSCSSVNGRHWIKTPSYKDLTDSHVPAYCSGQKVLIHKRVKAVRTKRSDASGYMGVYQFPSVDIDCERGKAIQSERYSLSQIADDFEDSAMGFHKKHGKFPSSLKLLEKVTLMPSLPPDPWGSAFYLDNSNENCRLMSPGEDKKAKTVDDRMIRMVKRRYGHPNEPAKLSSLKSSNSESKKTVKKTFYIPYYSSYRELLRSRGIPN